MHPPRWLFTPVFNVPCVVCICVCVQGAESDSWVWALCKMVLARGCVFARARRSGPAPHQMHKNCYSRDRSCAWFAAYILICSHGLSYHRIKYVNVPVEGSLWQWQPRLNTIGLNEATQSAFTTDTDSSLFGTSSVGLFGCLFMPPCESLWMKVSLRHGVYIRGAGMYMWVLLCQVLPMHMYDYLCWTILFTHICVDMLRPSLCVHASVSVCFLPCVMWVFVVAVLWPISSTADGWSVSVA